MNSKIRLQSAVELITTYSWVILIISIIIIVVFVFSSAPTAVLQTQCNFYSGFDCLDVVYFNTGSGGSQLVLYGIDDEQGVINFSSFHATENYVSSTSGYCTPYEVVTGQPFYCIANFAYAATTKTYTGVFNTTAGYCYSAPGAPYNYSCQASSSYSFGGDFNVAGGSAKPPFLITYLISGADDTAPTTNVLEINSINIQYQQLPLEIYYQSGTSHAAKYAPVITTPSYVYIFNSISGCGVTTEGSFFVVTASCAITATYVTATYGSCSQIENTGGQNLAGIDVRYCAISGYDMAGDNIAGGTIYASDMAGVNLDGSNLNGANLGYSDLEGATMNGANFNNANLEGAEMEDADAASGSNFASANLDYADMQGIDAAGSNFNKAQLQYVNLQNADLAGSNFASANLAYANLNGANTQGANFQGAYIVGCSGCP